MNRSYQYRGRMAPRVNYPACPLCQLESEHPVSRDALCETMVLAMSYVPMQEFVHLYEPEEGYRSGTIFAQLDKPFLAGGVSCG